MSYFEICGKKGAERIAQILLETASNRGLQPECIKRGSSTRFISAEARFVSAMATHLCVNPERIQQVTEDLLNAADDVLITTRPIVALTGMIQEWTTNNRSTASLDTLIDALSSHGFLEYKDDIKSQFSMVSTLERGRRQPQPPCCSSSSSSASLVPRTRALENLVIVKEIFKFLSLRDKKLFRRVNRFCLEETQAMWRKESWLSLYGGGDRFRFYRSSIHSLTLKRFYELFSELRNEEFEENTFGLVKRPFLRFKLSHVSFLNPYLIEIRDDFQFFYEFCGPRMTHLCLKECTFSCSTLARNFIKKILLEKCPNLEELRLENCNLPKRMDEARLNIQEPELEGEAITVAAKLRKFHYHIKGSGARVIKSILKILPNITDLAIFGNKVFLQGELFPTMTSHGIKLQQFKSSYKMDRIVENPYAPLFNYIRRFPDTLRQLELNQTTNGPVTSSRDFNAILVSLRTSLSVLKLHYKLLIPQEAAAEGAVVVTGPTWFTDFRGISLPNLTEFEISIQAPENIVKFDFLTLIGMPKLQILKIVIGKLPLNNRNQNTTVERQPGTQDWICMEPQNVFVYEGAQNQEELQQQQQAPWTGLESLQKLTFEGWKLTPEDITLLHGWFPNLTYLSATLNRETLLNALTSWINLHMVVLSERSERMTNVLMKSFRVRYEGVAIIFSK